ncbi:MAG: hypothetical protein KUG74_12040, partial [Rhodobacteraceae bacterium]|nr:hypothetical protein [Paracoccaceae bacterium]
AYGIITTIDDLEEAIKPVRKGTEGAKITAPSKLVKGDDLELGSGATPVFTVPDSHNFLSDEVSYLAFEKQGSLQLAAATIMFSFHVNKIEDWQALFSKDAKDFGDGGHLTAWVTDKGGIVVRIQSGDKNFYLEIENAVKAGQTYDFALSFGADGAELYLDGVRMAYDREITENWLDNSEALIIGGSGTNADPGTVSSVWSRLDGEITNFAVYDEQLVASDIDDGTPRVGFEYFAKSLAKYSFAQDSAGDLVVSIDGSSVEVAADTRFISFKDGTIAVFDAQFGSPAADRLDGGDASDLLIGNDGNDVFYAGGNDDFVFGGSGDDNLYGRDGSDKMFGGLGDDYLDGGSQSDILYGDEGDDEIKGEDGNDLMYGGLGDDYIYGHSWGDGGTAKNDRVVYAGNFADFEIEVETFHNSSRGEDVDRLIITDSASGGLDGFYEGKDRLMDIDFLIFADQTVAVTDLL